MHALLMIEQANGFAHRPSKVTNKPTMVRMRKSPLNSQATEFMKDKETYAEEVQAMGSDDRDS
jgi:hypothetical protein